MSKAKQAKKSKVKPFVKQVNCAWTQDTFTPGMQADGGQTRT
jgi:hypothetical protein